MWAHFCVCRHAECLQMYAVSSPFELLLNFPEAFSKLKSAYSQTSDPWRKPSGLWAKLFVAHNIVTLFVIHNVIHNGIRNVIHNTKPFEHYEHYEWQWSQFSIMNDIVIHNPIPTTWAKLAQNSFAINVNSTGYIVCQLKSICCVESSYSYLDKRLASLYHLKPSYLLKKLHRTLADMYLQGCHRNI